MDVPKDCDTNMDATPECQDSLQQATQNTRQLDDTEQEKLAKDTKVLSEFKQTKLEKEAQKNWDLFYKRNTTKFFKDRHWTTREFADLCGKPVDGGDRLVILEVGCGVGNFIFPLLHEIPNAFFYACDFSPRAVQFVKDNDQYDSERCQAFQNDLTADPLTAEIPADSVDIVSMIFVLSAVHPDKMAAALRNVYSVLKPGGCVLIRDYGLYDHAMLRFKPGHKLSENFYVRQDGTRAYFFSKEVLTGLFITAGFLESSIEYVTRETVNKKEGLCVPRVFVQGKFIKSATMATDIPLQKHDKATPSTVENPESDTPGTSSKSPVSISDSLDDHLVSDIAGQLEGDRLGTSTKPTDVCDHKNDKQTS